MIVALAPLLVLGVGAVAATAACDCGAWSLVKELGFPAAVAAFLLVRLEPRIGRLSEALHELALELAEWRGGRRPRDHDS